MKFPPQLAEALMEEQVLALQAVTAAKDAGEKNLPLDWEYFLRHVFRWYGRTFSVDPVEVEKHPIEDVVRHYWESYYEQLADDENRKASLSEAVRVLSENFETRREREAEAARVEREDARWHARASKEEAEARRKAEERAREAAATVSEAIAAEVTRGGSFRMVFEKEEEEDALGGSSRRAIKSG